MTRADPRRRVIVFLLALGLALSAHGPTSLFAAAGAADETMVICTVDGLQRIDLDTGAPSAPLDPAICSHCVLCSALPQGWLIAALDAGWSPSRAGDPWRSRLADGLPFNLAGARWSTAVTRAPPLLA